MQANIAVNSSGWMMTSNNCSEVAAHLQRRPPGHRHRLLDGVGQADVPRQASNGRRAVSLAGAWRSWWSSDLLGGLGWSSSSVSWPVRARNTSSRVGLATVDRLDADAGLAQRDQHVGGLVAAARATLSRRASGLGPAPRRAAGGRQAARSRSAGSVSWSWSEDADRGLELVGRALRDLTAAVDDRDAVGELVGLVEVLSGQQHGAAVARPARGWCPTSARGYAGRARWSARRGRSAAAG